MPLRAVNGMCVNIPEYMNVTSDGLLDFIEYRGVEILMYEEDKFCAIEFRDNKELEAVASTLQEIKIAIDNFLGLQ